MAIKRFFAEKDNTITNAYKQNLTSRATGSNMGASDILEVFSIYGQAATSSSELTRVLIQFDTEEIIDARAAGDIPAAGSVRFQLRMFNAPHQHTVPEDFKMVVAAISQSWDEGVGLDMDEYKEADESNWIKRNSTTSWDVEGGDFLTSSAAFRQDTFYTQTFKTGLEDLSVNVTDQVEEWINSNTGNYGFGVFMTSSIDTDTVSYYTKKFFGRGSEFFFKRPVLEARWNDSKKDNRGNFVRSSSLLSATDNLNSLYLYNIFRGEYKDIPSLANDQMVVSLYKDVITDTSPTMFTASKAETGIYSASVYLNTTASVIYDVWSTGSDLDGASARGIQFHTGSISPSSHVATGYNPSDSHIIKVTNLKKSYEKGEKPRFRIYSRNKNWNPTIYTIASKNIEAQIIENLYYRVSREADDLVIVDFSTGSFKYSLTGYDTSGNYFDFDMNLLEAGYSYALGFLAEENGNKKQIKNTFRFRVEEPDE
tara:strand:+ start:2697 stop:4142 length:1446 start_codon:yes stop_codon:yes gene_type:complete